MAVQNVNNAIPHQSVSSNDSSNHVNSNGKSKPKCKDEEKHPSTDQLVETSDSVWTDEPHGGEEEEQGITRCICGINDMFPLSSPTSLSNTLPPLAGDDLEVYGPSAYFSWSRC